MLLPNPSIGLTRTFYLLSRTKVNAVPAGLSLLLVCSKLFTILKTSLPNLFPSLNNNSLTVVVLKVSVVKDVMVLGPLMQSATPKSLVLSLKLNIPIRLRMVLATRNFKTLVSSPLNNSKLRLPMLIYKLPFKSNLFPFVLMPLAGLSTEVVPSKTALLILKKLITLSSLLVSMLKTNGRSEIPGVLLGVSLVILLLLLVTLVVSKTTLSSLTIELNIALLRI